jgi:aryl sulfotransferase
MIIVGRPPADVAMSLWNYFTGIKAFGFCVHDAAAKARGWNNGTFPRPTDYPSAGDFFRQWVHRRGFPFVDFVEIYRQAWSLRGNANVLLLHYNEIIGDLPAAVRRIAVFERVDLSEARVREIVALCNFDEMRRQSRTIAPSHKRFDIGHHFNKGIAGGGEWIFPRTEFRDEYRVLANALGSECFYWLDQTP